MCGIRKIKRANLLQTQDVPALIWLATLFKVEHVFFLILRKGVACKAVCARTKQPLGSNLAPS